MHQLRISLLRTLRTAVRQANDRLLSLGVCSPAIHSISPGSQGACVAGSLVGSSLNIRLPCFIIVPLFADYEHIAGCMRQLYYGSKVLAGACDYLGFFRNEIKMPENS